MAIKIKSIFQKIKALFDKYPWLYIVLMFIFWRLIIQIVVWWGDIRFDDAGYPYPTAVPGTKFLAAWAKWDSVYYYEIMNNGYNEHILEFFPLFPYISKAVNWIIGNHQLIATTFVVNFFALASCLMLYDLAKLENNNDEKFAQRAVFFMLIFPSAFFLVAHYTESLFLFLLITSFYCIRKKAYFKSGIFGMFASATRATGILAFPALIVDQMGDTWSEIKQKIVKRKIEWKKILPLCLVPLGFIAFLLLAQVQFNNPFKMFEAQKAFGRKVEINLLKPVHKELKNIFNLNLFYDEIPTNAFNYVLFWSLFLIAVILLFKYSRPSYAVLGFLFFAVPAFSGTLISMNRFLLTLFPIYFLLAKLIPPNTIWEKLYIIFSFAFFIHIMLLFTNGFWVG